MKLSLYPKLAICITAVTVVNVANASVPWVGRRSESDVITVSSEIPVPTNTFVKTVTETEVPEPKTVTEKYTDIQTVTAHSTNVVTVTPTVTTYSLSATETPHAIRDNEELLQRVVFDVTAEKRNSTVTKSSASKTIFGVATGGLVVFLATASLIM